MLYHKLRHHDTNPVLIRFVFAHVASSSSSPSGNKGQLHSISIRKPQHTLPPSPSLSPSPSLTLSCSSQRAALLHNLVVKARSFHSAVAGCTTLGSCWPQVVDEGRGPRELNPLRKQSIKKDFQVELMFHSGALPST